MAENNSAKGKNKNAYCGKNKAESEALFFEKEEKENKILELEAEGLDMDDLSMMDYDERREVIEEAGLDPDDYDFD